MTKRKELPEAVAYRSGCKVCWKYYDNEADAKLSAARAREAGIRQAERGYDFGFCCPGTCVRQTVGQYAGLWEVCWP